MKNRMQRIYNKMIGNHWVLAILLIGLPALVFANQNTLSDKAELKIFEDRGGDFTLMEHSGKNVSLRDYRGKVVLLNFGYTSCPDVCPMVLSHLKQTMTRLEHLSDQVQVIFITLDPERDTPERLKEYVTYFHPSFLGLSGDTTEINEVVRQYRVRYYKESHPSIEGYFVAHTDYIYLLDQQGRYRGKYKSRWALEQMGKDIRQLLHSKIHLNESVSLKD